MTRSEQAKAALNNNEMDFTELLTEADKIAEAYEQDFDNETTYFEYGDGSVAVFNGMSQTINTYGCR